MRLPPKITNRPAPSLLPGWRMNWTSDIQDMIRVLEEVKDDPHYHLVGIFDDADKLAGTITLSKCLDLTAKARFYYSLENLVIDENYRQQGYVRP